MPNIDMGTKPDNYIMFCVGMSLYAFAGDVGENTVYETLCR